MKAIVERHVSNGDVGICSVCSAHPWVIEATLRFESSSNNKVLIESTSNQVNQFGGYTGMIPTEFRDFVYDIAKRVGFPIENIILGGDHLGPNCWQSEPAESAMLKSEQLIKAYITAGYSKIHLDTSMSCADDPVPLDPMVVARRAARLAKVSETVASAELKEILTYVIGTEVPTPGGEKEAIQAVHVTEVDAAKLTIETHKQAFEEAGVYSALDRVVGIVVQPAVEFDHSNVIHYKPEKAQQLSDFIESTPFVYEAHSTDYQTKENLRHLVNDHFAILKVGPWLTFAMREAVYALAEIEKELVDASKQSHAKEVINQILMDDKRYWEQYYSHTFSDARVQLSFSLSDRIRYYWTDERIVRSLDVMIDNLNSVDIPLGLLSQYLPVQYSKVLSGELNAKPMDVIFSKVQEVLEQYAYACEPRKAS
ncbi:tagatose-bisphosphate aldolase subunit GatZ [Vibrio sp. ZSDZ65]|uniref:D-tagatose-1,6-bisphosphate aldolase subunit GatZ n=1 Tax=Vibrio qingdaonensis TaxID=2829491 RepID=A0A9X3CMF3_9VIBR|nr:tagatose-bisphosphate aldolase subunit GatZ [Vibrio qingdaonensis]MCW8345819.1 tagatose-bisphosphate aldolase subunit GatZ [Vibrio qingdaonensis]